MYNCRGKFQSTQDLEERRHVCDTIKDFAPYTCDECGAQCTEEADLGRHGTTYHGVGTVSQDPLTFRRKSEIDDNNGVCHVEDGLQF